VLLASAGISTNVEAGGTYTNTMSVTIPTVTEDAYFLILSVDDDWQVLEKHQLNNEYAVPIDVVTPKLINGVAATNTLPSEGASQLFRLEVSSGQILRVTLDDLDNQGSRRSTCGAARSHAGPV